MPATISWPELIVLMAFGDGREDRIRGTIRTCGGADADKHTTRVARRGELVRIEMSDGRPSMIIGVDTRWVNFGRDGVPTAYRRATSSFSWFGQELLYRKPPSRWEGSDFTKLTGPIEAVEFLGRPAWAFELAPPSHKPYPMQMTVDAATGLVLRQGNAAFGSFEEWTSLELDADLPDELFVWDGPFRSPEDHEAEHERDMANRRAWLAARGISELPLAFGPELVANQWDDESGAFHASFETNVHGSLVRRPRSDEPWPELESQNWPHHYRWSDERWDWFVGCVTELGAEQLAQLRSGLATAT
jgi:hypothetical protein